MRTLKTILLLGIFSLLSGHAFSQGGGFGFVVGGMYNLTAIEESDTNFLSSKNGFGYKAGISLYIPFGERIAINLQPAFSVRYHGDEEDSLGLVTHQVLELPVVFRHSFVDFDNTVYIGYILGLTTDIHLSSERSIKDITDDVTEHYKSLYFSFKAGLPISVRQNWGKIILQPFAQVGLGTLLNQDFEQTVNGALTTPFKDVKFGQQFYGAELIYLF